MIGGLALSAALLKRVLDVGLAIAGLFLTLPILGATALAIRVTMGSLVLFTMVRPGLAGKPFVLLKFRTMRPAIGAEDEIRYAERVTLLGGWLRRTSLDEIPQMFDVIWGELSLVGPRPLLMDYFQLHDSRQARRHNVRAGITVRAQINGRDSISMDQRFEYDVWYVDNWSLWRDAEIIARTVWCVISRHGVGRDDTSIEPPGKATGLASARRARSPFGHLELLRVGRTRRVPRSRVDTAVVSKVGSRGLGI
jgi:lipopolysaccharide/colanic/teichoic acid biosynthesis glycosyltransferase